MSDWQKTTFGKVATGFLSGGTPTTSRADYWKGEIPWITSKIEMLYEIISPDAFLRPFIEEYASTLSSARPIQGASRSIASSSERPTSWCRIRSAATASVRWSAWSG